MFRSPPSSYLTDRTAPLSFKLTGLVDQWQGRGAFLRRRDQINKSTYGKLAKIPLNSSVTSLERDANGMMNLTRGSAAECVVPSNLKFDKDESLTPAQLADRAVLHGTSSKFVAGGNHRRARLQTKRKNRLRCSAR